jgi:amidase
MTRSSHLDPALRSASWLAAEIRAGRIGCREALEHYLERVSRLNPLFNAVIQLDTDGARARADAADRALARGEVLGPLHGVPMTVKESFDVAGMVTSWGAPEFKDYRPARTAVCVERLAAAGANVFGKTNVPYFLGDIQTHNALYGTTSNPWNPARTPGGSSGGSAAALAAGLTALEIGSDIASSIRTPAHYCGVYGHKPTYHLVTPRGQQVPGRQALADLAVVGPMARSAEDLALALRIMAGPDRRDGAVWRVRLPRPRRRRLQDFRIAVLSDTDHAPVDASVREALQHVVDALRRAGASVDERARPDFDTQEADRLFHRLLDSALSARILEEAFRAAQRQVARLEEDDDSAASSVRNTVLSHRDWLIANERRHQMRVLWEEFFQDYDVMLTPPAATVAPTHHHQGEPFDRPLTVNGGDMPLRRQFFWCGYPGLAYLPATVAPIGMAEGLPVGVQIIGPEYGDLTCIQFAGLLTRHVGGFQPPPACLT